MYTAVPLSADELQEEKKRVQQKQFFARVMRSKAKAWLQITSLRLCHRFGTVDVSPLCKLPVELVVHIEDALMLAEGAPSSLEGMIQAY